MKPLKPLKTMFLCQRSIAAGKLTFILPIALVVVWLMWNSLQQFEHQDRFDAWPQQTSFPAPPANSIHHPQTDTGLLGSRPPDHPPLSSEQFLCHKSAKEVILVFPHVPKSGGSTIECTFDPKYDYQLCHRFTQEPRTPNIAQRPIRLLHLHEVAHGSEFQKHFNMNEPQGCYRWIFTMRHPYSRTLSAFYHTRLKRSADIGQHFFCASPVIKQMFLQPNFTFDQFAALPKSERDTCLKNYQTNYLVAPVSKFKTYGHVLNVRKAKQVLRNKFHWIGIVEKYPISLHLLSWQLGLNLTVISQVSNFAPVISHKPYSEQVEQALFDLNELDLQVYEEAVKIVESRIRAMKRYYGGTYPWKDSTPMNCDSDYRCLQRGSQRYWNKNKESTPDWFTQAKPAQQFSDFLCGPFRGCQMTPLSALVQTTTD